MHSGLTRGSEKYLAPPLGSRMETACLLFKLPYSSPVGTRFQSAGILTTGVQEACAPRHDWTGREYGEKVGKYSLTSLSRHIPFQIQFWRQARLAEITGDTVWTFL